MFGTYYFALSILRISCISICVFLLVMLWFRLKVRVERTVLNTPYGLRIGYTKGGFDPHIVWFIIVYWRDKEEINRRDGAKSRTGSV